MFDLSFDQKNNILSLLQNRQGKTRLSKWYVPYDDDEKVSFVLHIELQYATFLTFFSISFHSLQQHKVRLRGEVHRLVAPRDQKYQSNFVEVRLSNRLLACFLYLTIDEWRLVSQLQDCL